MNTKRLLQITAIIALTACAARSGSPDAEWNGGTETSGEIRIDVLNHNFSDATIWAVIRESSRRRLGVVTGKTDETYVLEWDFTQPLRLEIDLLAGSRCLTRPRSGILRSACPMMSSCEPMQTAAVVFIRAAHSIGSCV